MILTNLKLENFKKYTSHSIAFEEGLIGIIGKNGSGKSTIFEAILFALYGELKNKGDKEIVKNVNANIKDAVVLYNGLRREQKNLPVGIDYELEKAINVNLNVFDNRIKELFDVKLLRQN